MRIATTIAAALVAAAIASPALAQNGPPPSPYTPRVDKPTCTMDELKAATTAYVEGQKKGTLAALPLHDKAEYLQNMKTVPAADGLWNTALPVAHAMSFHDPLRCKTFSEVIVTEGTPYVIGTRLYLDKGKVIRVDSIVTKKGDWLFNANAYAKYSKAEDWGPLMKYQHTPPAEMIRGANAYLDAFADKFTDIPWGQPCARLEGGAYTNREGKPDASCEVGIPKGVLYIVNRDYLIDPEKGVINVFCRFGSSEGGADVHTFRYIDGKIRAVHTLTAIPGPQANDEGGFDRAGVNPNA
ncbi:hypothetical protein [Croceibacterium aestuarii]|uniref:hypothetical protein n=1 Tax=Croceibacterium aestuarii TaxID=3064139 RepID=UPI00272E5180|nr:hypothetical protein [Croceibacterium sp. D39]